LLTFSPFGYSQKETNKHDSCYKVYKIKPIGNCYQIYAKRDGEYFKIISKKDTVAVGEKIRIGKCYLFNLKSRAELAPVIDGVKILPMNYLDITYMYWGTPIKIDGDKITDLYFADNIAGLYFTGSK